MNNYMQRLGLTAWRKKTTILVAVGFLSLIIFGLQFSNLEEKSPNLNNLLQEERDDEMVAAAVAKSIKNVRFIEANRNRIPATEIDAEMIQSNKNDVRRDVKSEKQFEKLQMEQQLGVPFVNIDPKNPYIPNNRLVHLDLKGAPPLIVYLKKFFPLIKSMGATGILLEYEDMFPFSGTLKNISSKNAYTVENIKEILSLAENSQLEVIPLIQTFGHVEFALKHAEFAYLREVNGSPQALCPSRKSSLNFIAEMVNQVMALHPSVKYLHIGCDEVFQMGECDLCRLEIHENLFLKHIKNIVDIVRLNYPKLKIIIWDDMLRHISQQSMFDAKLGELVEPMVWVYAEDIYRFVQPTVWEKYAAVFPTAWTASAFKGAFGETLYVPNARRHLENSLRWLDTMAAQSPSFKDGLAGIAITGWQRYDHFAVLCELLPASLPSLALNLLAVTTGYFNLSLRDKFLKALHCPEPSIDSSPFIMLESDPFLWEKVSRCTFPGSPVFRLTNRFHNLELEAKEFLDVTTKQKGWMTAYNIRHNYSLALRVEELTIDLPRLYHGMISLARATVDAMDEIFDNYTITEWIEQKIYPYILEFEKIQNDSVVLKSVNHWPSRPLPLSKEMQKLVLNIGLH
ncbi:hexosaminidase D-like [Diabrotica virgifera virgifera]|uniref:beta-N-acetylhexosaminidase n=1 Tax=Diabrotica virgifera virgifera TaxID=50390 RepID=A0A6P7FJ87_DIAVI|nr:hexosaminidase D-like [Diabrotica virgifera virgifera]